MVRISNTNIPDNKNIAFALPYIYGIGQSRAQKIIKKLEFSLFKKTRDLIEDEIKAINEEIKRFTIEDELKKIEKEIIRTSIRLGTYRGTRYRERLPANGQRTRSNARTAKGRKRATVANKKKAPTPK